jgi:dipeptidase
MMESLRDHGGDPRWRPDRQTGAAVCMHAKDPLFGRSQTTGSLVARIGRDRKNFYATGASTPCLGPFFPVFAPGTALPAGYAPGTADYDPASYWWESERWRRRALSRFGGARRLIAPRLKDFEERMIKDAEHSPGPLSQAFIDRNFEEARAVTRAGGAGLDGLPAEPTGLIHRLYWSWYNRRNRIP